MAGSGYKNFTTGSVLTASDVQNYLMDQSVMVFAGTASRGSAITSPSEGMVVYLSDTDEVQVYNGTSWSAVGGGAAVLSNTPTGTYTDAGGTAWAYYQFTASGTATVTKAGFADVLVVGGGGGGGNYGGGGGAGGYVELSNGYLPSGTHNVRVGAGGAGAVSAANASIGKNGTASGIANFFVAIGGGGGGSGFTINVAAGMVGGSGGGGGAALSAVAGSGFVPQGKDGGAGGGTGNDFAGGGGGANAVGGAAAGTVAGSGGNGLANAYTNTSVTRAGGGGGGSNGGTAGSGGTGGGGGGTNSNSTATSGTVNTGGGGGGSGYTSPTAGAGGAGGSGVVIIRVRT